MASGERKGNGRARRNGQFMPAMVLSGHGAAIVAMFPQRPHLIRILFPDVIPWGPIRSRRQ